MSTKEEKVDGPDVRLVTVTRAPVDDLDLVRRVAVRNGHIDSDASAMRYALIELAKRIRDGKVRA